MLSSAEALQERSSASPLGTRLWWQVSVEGQADTKNSWAESLPANWPEEHGSTAELASPLPTAGLARSFSATSCPDECTIPSSRRVSFLECYVLELGWPELFIAKGRVCFLCNCSCLSSADGGSKE